MIHVVYVCVIIWYYCQIKYSICTINPTNTTFYIEQVFVDKVIHLVHLGKLPFYFQRLELLTTLDGTFPGCFPMQCIAVEENVLSSRDLNVFVFFVCLVSEDKDDGQLLNFGSEGACSMCLFLFCTDNILCLYIRFVLITCQYF